MLTGPTIARGKRVWLPALLLGLAITGPVPASAGDWFASGVEFEASMESRFHVRVPDFANDPSPSSWRTELELKTDVEIFADDDWWANFHVLAKPSYEGLFDTQPDTYGESVDKARYGTGASYPDNRAAKRSSLGKRFDGRGGRVAGEFTILNADTISDFTGERVPAVAVDSVASFGGLAAPIAARGSGQDAIGGNASGITFEGLRDNYAVFNGVSNGGLPAGSGLDASLGMASASLSTPLNFYAGSMGDRSSFKRSSFDVNRTENSLKFACRDNANSTCMFREFFFDIEKGNTFVRLGRQQIVWGKTDYFRLQDVINPVDLGTHNVLDSLEDRRIPQLALDVTQAIGKVGPLEDFSLEFAWVFDQFTPDQFGQCGEAWAFSVSCQVRAGAAIHQFLNLSLAGTEEVDWEFLNTQPGVRMEFRLPKPGISFSLSAFYGFQQTPVTRFRNPYSTNNPNAAAMLLLQGSTDESFEPFDPTGSVAAGIDQLSLASQGSDPPFAHSGGAGQGVWVTGFDPYDRTGRTPTPSGTLEGANQDLQNAWYFLNEVIPESLGGCAGLAEGSDLNECRAGISQLGLPWSASEMEFEYPRLLTLGASMDYEIPGIATVLRLEMAGEINRSLQNQRYDDPDGVTESSVYKLAFGLDRSFQIPFLTPGRAALVSFQTFFEHIVDYEGGRVGGDGMVRDENSTISTLFIRNYWLDNRLRLSNLAVVDWNASAVLYAPKLRWAWDEHLSFEMGVNLFWGQTKRHIMRDVCADGSLGGGGSGCSFADPTTWQEGNWQMLNGPLERATQASFGYPQQSFADGFMRSRDEFFVGATYRF